LASNQGVGIIKCNNLTIVYRSFVDKITSTIDKNIVLLNTILLMGQTLGIKVIAEGVEDNQQLKYLKEKNCDFYQGYLKSKPLPEDEFIKLLQKDLL